MWNECFRNKSEKTFQIKVFPKILLVVRCGNTCIRSVYLEIKIKQSKAMKVADAARQTHNQCNQKKRNVAEHSHNLNRKKAVVTLHLINK